MRQSTPEFLDHFESYRADRGQLLMLAAASARLFDQLGPLGFCRYVESTAPDYTAAANILGQTQWHRHGLQSVELSHKLAAALMATSAVGALDDARLPWPAFEIQVPPGLLESSHGEVFSCLVHARPEWLPRDARTRDGRESAGVIALYYDARTIGHIGLTTLSEIARFEPATFPQTGLGLMRDVVAAEFDREKEDRTKQLLMRLITGVILLITEARADKPQAFPQYPLRPAKRDKVRANTHRVVRPVTIDVTASVRDYCRNGGSDSPHVTSLVRGHWRQQAHGPRHSLRRTQWIEPFWRGEGPLHVRPTRLRDEPTR